MNKIAFSCSLACLCMLASAFSPARPEEGNAHPILALWPAGPPGVSPSHLREHDTTEPGDPLIGGRRVARLTDVSDPTMTFYAPPAGRGTGAAVVVFPGGGYRVLAMDLEGSEICDWLNSIGVAAILLKYRVPDEAPFRAPLEDAQRSLGLVRSHARQWHIDPRRIGVLGFSAGGHLAASLCSNSEERVYQAVDEADTMSCRPDFTVLIYPAYLAAGGQGSGLAPGLRVTEKTPPAFLVQANDDPIGVGNSVEYCLALLKAKVPAEMHLYAAGGHGYGLRLSPMPVSTWPARLKEWLQGMGVIPPRSPQGHRARRR